MVAHNLHLELLPAEKALLDQDLVDRGNVEPVGNDALILLPIVGDAAAGASKREGGTDDQGINADRLGGAASLLQLVDHGRFRHIQPDPEHGLLEQLPVLALRYGGRLCPDHLDPVLGQDPLPVQIHREIQRGLPPQSRKKRRRPLGRYHLFQDLRRKRFYIGDIGEFRIGHDRRRIGVHQDYPISLLLERLAGLSPRIIEFTGLANHDGAGADDQNGLNVCTLWHLGTGWHKIRARVEAGETRRKPIVTAQALSDLNQQPEAAFAPHTELGR